MQNEFPSLPADLNSQLARRINRQRGAAMMLELIAQLQRDEADDLLALATLQSDGEEGQ